MNEFLAFLYDNWFKLLLVIGMFLHRKEFIVALRGGNGKAQMDELAKGAIVGLLIFTVYQEAYRSDLSKQVFSDTFYLILISGVFSIAAIKPAMEVWASKNDEPDTKIIQGNQEVNVK